MTEPLRVSASRVASRYAGIAKKAGFFSWECKGCGKSLLSEAAARNTDYDWMVNVVAVFSDDFVVRGEYDGYGGIEGRYGDNTDIDQGSKGPSLWHELCWKKAGKPDWTGPSRDARDQGWFFDSEDYEGTTPNRR